MKAALNDLGARAAGDVDSDAMPKANMTLADS